MKIDIHVFLERRHLYNRTRPFLTAFYHDNFLLFLVYSSKTRKISINQFLFTSIQTSIIQYWNLTGSLPMKSRLIANKTLSYTATPKGNAYWLSMTLWSNKNIQYICLKKWTKTAKKRFFWTVHSWYGYSQVSTQGTIAINTMNSWLCWIYRSWQHNKIMHMNFLQQQKL